MTAMRPYGSLEIFLAGKRYPRDLPTSNRPHFKSPERGGRRGSLKDERPAFYQVEEPHRL